MFEAAKFMRDNIRKSSRALGQSSDSSSMYAKGVYEYTTVIAMKRALHLIEELGCGKVSSTHEEVNSGNSIEPRELQVSIEKVNKVLGITVPTEDILRILKSLDFNPKADGELRSAAVDALGIPDISIAPASVYTSDNFSGVLNLRHNSFLHN